MAASPKTKPSADDYEKLGRAVEGALITDYVELLGNTRRQLKLSLLRGIAAGLGSVIGATVVVAILVWILHSFGGLPVVGHWLQITGTQINQ
jgi:chromate transport protein ChrA